MVEGSCLCGAVRFLIDGATSGIVECACSMCRKAAGGASGAFLVARRGDVRWLGEDALAHYRSSPGLVRSFCQHCGTAMTGANLVEADDTIILAANALDDDLPPSVIAVEHCASQARWHDNAEKAPHYDGTFPGWQTLKP